MGELLRFKKCALQIMMAQMIPTRRKLMQTVGLLSFTFLTRAGLDRIVVPMIEYEFMSTTSKWTSICSKQHFVNNLSLLLQWPPFSTEEELLKHFDDIGDHGTKIIFYNLWLNDEGEMELDFQSDPVGSVITSIGFLKEAPLVNIHVFNVYHKNRLILPFWHVVGGSSVNRSRGVVGVLEANFVKPTHNKQDFEKTSLFQKLENRLKEMTWEYWDYHCGLIGYHAIKQHRAPSQASPEFGKKTACDHYHKSLGRSREGPPP